jgi:hypothetical protein
MVDPGTPGVTKALITATGRTPVVLYPPQQVGNSPLLVKRRQVELVLGQV